MVEFMPEVDSVNPNMKNDELSPVESTVAPPVVTSGPDSFVFTSETPRYYVNRGLEVHFGDKVEWPDGAPDVLWDPAN